jgi:hypothetical protein
VSLLVSPEPLPNDRSSERSLGAGRPAAEEEGQKKHDDEQNEENLRDPRRGTCNSSETEYCCDKCNNQEGERPTKHKIPFYFSLNRSQGPGWAYFSGKSSLF